MATEAQYQARLIVKIKQLLPGCVVLKNDPQYQQGILDLTILYFGSWGMLEVKKDGSAPFRPNQEYFIKQLDEMSYASVIHPGNEEEVLDALQRALSHPGPARIPQP